VGRLVCVKRVFCLRGLSQLGDCLPNELVRSGGLGPSVLRIKGLSQMQAFCSNNAAFKNC